MEAKLAKSKDCSDREKNIELITKKLDSAADLREQHLAALRNRLKEHVSCSKDQYIFLTLDITQRRNMFWKLDSSKLRPLTMN